MQLVTRRRLGLHCLCENNDTEFMLYKNCYQLVHYNFEENNFANMLNNIGVFVVFALDYSYARMPKHSQTAKRARNALALPSMFWVLTAIYRAAHCEIVSCHTLWTVLLPSLTNDSCGHTLRDHVRNHDTMERRKA